MSLYRYIAFWQTTVFTGWYSFVSLSIEVFLDVPIRFRPEVI